MSVAHTDVAAYSLGLLDATDREDFEAHLAGCRSCTAELGEFSAMAHLFADLGPVVAQVEEPDQSAVADLVARRAAVRRRQVRQRAWFGAAAGIVLLSVGVAAGFGVAPSAAPPAFGQPHSATNPASGLTGTVGLVTKTWGTQVTLKLSGLETKNALKCQLIAVSKAGLRRVMVGWLVDPPGDGVSGHPPLLLVGGTWIAKGDLSEIQIQVFQGPTLLTIPI